MILKSMILLLWCIRKWLNRRKHSKKK